MHPSECDAPENKTVTNQASHSLILSLFPNIGMLDKAFEEAGFCVVRGPDLLFGGDIKNFHPPKDVFWGIIGGPPCQDFSSAGKRDETLGRADLTLSYANIVVHAKPEWFVMENVERIMKSKILKEAISIFKSAGYGISYDVLDASYCGVPQSRKRFFLVGHKNSTDNFLNPYFQKNQSKKPMTLHDYFGDTLGLEYYYRHPRSYARRGVFSIYEPSPTIRGVNRPVPNGYPGHSGDPVSVSKNVRPLTTEERSQIQTFPKNFVFNGNKTETEQIIGNAVPVKLGEFVANCIKEYIFDLQKDTKITSGQLELEYI